MLANFHLSRFDYRLLVTTGLLVTAGWLTPTAGASAIDTGAAATIETTSGQHIVGRVGDTTLDYSQVEAHAAAELAPLDSQRDEILQRHLEEMVAERLLELEATRRGFSVSQLVAAEITDPLTPVTEEEIQDFYDANRQQILQPLEAVSSEVGRYLHEQRAQQRRNALVTSLSQRFPVTLAWSPLRLDVGNASSPTRGPENAPVELVVFSDFQCPWCSRIAPDLEELAARYDSRLRWTYRHLPLESLHPQARAAAEAAVCADEQGAFWPWHDALFARQSELATLDLRSLADTLKLDGESFAQCLASERPTQTVATDVQAARQLGISRTPSLFVNGRQVQLKKGRPIADQIADVVDEELGSVPSG